VIPLLKQTRGIGTGSITVVDVYQSGFRQSNGYPDECAFFAESDGFRHTNDGLGISYLFISV
jgi:hypothetical protein